MFKCVLPFDYEPLSELGTAMFPCNAGITHAYPIVASFLEFTPSNHGNVIEAKQDNHLHLSSGGA